MPGDGIAANETAKATKVISWETVFMVAVGVLSSAARTLLANLTGYGTSLDRDATKLTWQLEKGVGGP